MILWIDDEVALIRRYGDSIGRNLHQELHYASDIATALVRLKRQRYQLIIIDIKIPLGSLSDEFSTLARFFETDSSNAGFGFITAVQSGALSTLAAPPKSEQIIACTNYPNAFFERYLSSGQQRIAYFLKANLIDKLETFGDLCRQLLPNAEALKPATMPTLSHQTKPNQPPIETSFERTVGNLLHEINRSIAKSNTLVEDIKLRYLKMFPQTKGRDRSSLFAVIDKELGSLATTLGHALDEIIDHADQKSMSRVDALSDAYKDFKSDIQNFSLAKVTLVDKHVENLIYRASSISGPAGRTVTDAAHRALSLFQVAAISDLQQCLYECRQLITDLEQPSVAIDKMARSFFVYEIINEVSQSLGDLADRKSVKLDLKIGYIKNTRLAGSSLGFQKIVMNLIENAIKYSHRMVGRRAWVIVRGRTLERRFLEISIENWGAKIADSEHAQLEGAGQRGKHAIGPGTGRGLNIVRDELDRLSGTLKITSRRDDSFTRRQTSEDEEAFVNTFTITIPLVAA